MLWPQLWIVLFQHQWQSEPHLFKQHNATAEHWQNVLMKGERERERDCKQLSNKTWHEGAGHSVLDVNCLPPGLASVHAHTQTKIRPAKQRAKSTTGSSERFQNICDAIAAYVFEIPPRFTKFIGTGSWLQINPRQLVSFFFLARTCCSKSLPTSTDYVSYGFGITLSYVFLGLRPHVGSSNLAFVFFF